MRISRNGFLISLALAATSLSIADIAFADARTEARRHFRHGMDLVVAGQVDEGIAELEEAYAILPHPNVLYNIGRAYAEVGRYDEAREYFDRYLESDPPDREEVRAIVAAIDQRIASRATASAETTGTGTTGTGTGTTGAGTGTGTGTIRVAGASPAQIEEMRATARDLRSIAQLSGSAALTARADELERLASAMEQAALETGTGAAGTGAGTTGTGTGTTGTGTGTTGVGAATGTTGTDATLDVAAANQAGLYEEEVVSSSRFAQSPLDAASATTIITRQDIRLTGITSFPELLRRAAGVHVMAMTPGDSEVAIRGFNRTLAPRVVFLINGRSTYVDALSFNLPQQQSIDVEDVERIEIVRGPASALYGANAFSGIINIITRAPGDSPGTDVTIGGGNGGQLRGHVATNGRTGILSYRLSAGYQQADRWTRAYSDQARSDLTFPSGYDQNRAIQEEHARADLSVRLGQNVRLNSEGGYSYAQQLNLWGVAGYGDLAANGTTGYAMAGLQSNWGSIRGFFNRVEYSVVPTSGEMPAFHMTGNTVDVEAVLAHEFDIGIPHNVHFGLGYRWKAIDWDVLDRRHDQNHYSLFFEDTMRVSDLVRITAGFRTDRHPLIDKLIWSPRVALVLRPTEGQSIRIGGTSSFRTMSMAESYASFAVPSTSVTAAAGFGIGSELATRYFGSPSLKPERIITAEIGYLNQENDFLAIDVAAYYNRVWNIIDITGAGGLYTLENYSNPSLAPFLGFDRDSDRFLGANSINSNPVAEYNVFGSELGIRLFPADGLDIYANYSLNFAYVANPLPGQSNREERQPRHMVNSGFQYRSSIGLDLAADLHVYARTVSPENVVGATGVTNELLTTPAYYMINGRVGYRLLDDRLEIGVAAQNITNNHVRQNGNGQVMQARVMASLTARF